MSSGIIIKDSLSSSNTDEQSLVKTANKSESPFENYILKANGLDDSKKQNDKEVINFNTNGIIKNGKINFSDTDSKKYNSKEIKYQISQENDFRFDSDIEIHKHIAILSEDIPTFIEEANEKILEENIILDTSLLNESVSMKNLDLITTELSLNESTEYYLLNEVTTHLPSTQVPQQRAELENNSKELIKQNVLLTLPDIEVKGIDKRDIKLLDKTLVTQKTLANLSNSELASVIQSLDQQVNLNLMHLEPEISQVSPSQQMFLSESKAVAKISAVVTIDNIENNLNSGDLIQLKGDADVVDVNIIPNLEILSQNIRNDLITPKGTGHFSESDTIILPKFARKEIDSENGDDYEINLLENDEVFANQLQGESKLPSENQMSEITNFIKAEVGGSRLEISFDEYINSNKEVGPLKLEEQITMSLKYALFQNRSEVSISLYPKSLGHVDVKIEFILNSIGQNEVQKVVIIVDKLSTLKLFETTKAQLEATLIELKREANLIVIETDKKEAFLGFEMKNNNSGQKNESYFASNEERENWMNRFQDLISVDNNNHLKIEDLTTDKNAVSLGYITSSSIDIKV